MGEYEPNDSRNVTQIPQTAPGEPPRTGPREGETRSDPPVDETDAQKRERAMDEDADELDASEDGGEG
jgi:hypothetical protein